MLESLKKIYFALEDGYYDFMDKVNEHLPVYKIIDPIDKVIPTFILFFLLFLLIIGGIAFLVVPGLLPQPLENATLRVTDSDGIALQNVSVSLEWNDNNEKQELQTNSRGVISIAMQQESRQAQLKVEQDGFETYNERVTFYAGRVKSITLQRPTAGFETNYQLLFLHSETEQSIRGTTITVSFRCSNGSPAPRNATVTQGSYMVSKPTNCDTLIADAVPLSGFEPSYNNSILTNPFEIYLEPVASAANGYLDVTVQDGSNHAVANATVRISTSNEPSVQSGRTDTQGEKSFELAPGNYTVTALANDGRTDSETVTIRSEETETLSLNIGNPTGDEKHVLLKIIDQNSHEPIQGTAVSIYRNTFLLDRKESNEQGLVEQTVIPGEHIVFSAVISNPSYILKLVPTLPVKAASDNSPTVIELEAIRTTPRNYGEALAIVQYANGTKIEGARVYLDRSDYSNHLLGPLLSDEDGEATFSNLPQLQNAVYSVFAVTDRAEGRSGTNNITPNTTVPFPVVLVPNAGFFEITVLDNNNQQAVIDANVRAFTRNGNEETNVDENTTNAQGVYHSAPLRSEQAVFFEIRKNGYLPYHTVGQTITPNQTKTLTVQLERTPPEAENAGVEIRLDRVYRADGSSAGFLESPGHYKAVFTLQLPKDITYLNPAVHVEAGLHDAGHANVNQNPHYFTNAVASGNSYTATFSQTTNLQDLFANPSPVASGEPAKQANIAWQGLNQGSYEIESNFTILPDLTEDTAIWFYFQAKAQIPNDWNNSPLYNKQFLVGYPLCLQDCNALAWRFLLSEAGETETKPYMLNDSNLFENTPYQLKFKIFNQQNTGYITDPATPFRFTDKSGITSASPSVGNEWQRQTIPANNRTEYGLTHPIAFTTTTGDASGFVLTLNTAPTIPDTSKTQRLRFGALQGTHDLNIEYSSNSNGDLNLTIKDTTTGQAFQANNGVWLITSCNENYSELDFSHATQLQYNADSTELNRNNNSPLAGILQTNCAVIEARANGYRTQRIQIRRNEPRFNFEQSCIQVDMEANSTTIQAEKQINRNSTHSIRIVSNNCRNPVRVELKTLSGTGFESLQGISFRPNSVLVQPNSDETITVSIPSTAPLGYIPILALDNENTVIAFGEFQVWPIPETDALGIVNETGR